MGSIPALILSMHGNTDSYSVEIGLSGEWLGYFFFAFSLLYSLFGWSLFGRRLVGGGGGEDGLDGCLDSEGMSVSLAALGLISVWTVRTCPLHAVFGIYA